MQQEENLIGEKFGYLEVTGMVKEFRSNIGKRGKFGYFAICNCLNCGKEGYKTLKSSLKRGSTKSCGCRRDFYKSGENHPQFTGYKEISGKKWSDYQKKAEHRKFAFELDIGQAWSLYESQSGKCALSGLPIAFGRNATASLDRIDSTLGYISGNVQWVHKDINKIKFNMPESRFVELCCLVAEHHHGTVNQLLQG